MAHEFENNPNSVMEDTIDGISILTSYDPAYFTDEGEGFGVGSLKPRSIAADMALYQPYNSTFDTIVSVMGGFDVATKYVHEWIQDDEFWHDEAFGKEDPPDNADVINNVDNTPDNPYDPAVTDKYFVVTDDDGAIYRAGDTVRYAGDDNGTDVYVNAVILKKGPASELVGSGDGTALKLRSIDYDEDGNAGNLLPATSNDAIIERMFSLRGSDRSYPVQPRGTIPQMYKTYIQVASLDTAFSQRSGRDDSFFPDLVRKQQKLMGELKRGRELMFMYSKGGEFSIPSDADQDMGTEGDPAYTADGIWHQVDNFNQLQFDTSSDQSIRDSLRTLMEHNFGGESGGPEIRQVFGSAKYISDVESAYEDQRRYYSTEYVAGVRVMRYESGLGLMDFIWNPLFEYKHPKPDGSLRHGSGKSVALMCSVPDNFVRLEYIGEGPRIFSFVEKGGQREEYMRIEVSAGLQTQLLQWMATHVED